MNYDDEIIKEAVRLLESTSTEIESMGGVKTIELAKSPMTTKVLAKLILHLDDWAYEMFSEGDYSEDWRELKNWAREHR